MRRFNHKAAWAYVIAQGTVLSVMTLFGRHPDDLLTVVAIGALVGVVGFIFGLLLGVQDGR